MERSNLGFLGSLLGFLIALIIGSGSALEPPEGLSFAYPATLLSAGAVYALGMWASHDISPLKVVLLTVVALMSLGLVLLFGVPLYPGIDGHFLGIMFVVPSAFLMAAALYLLPRTLLGRGHGKRR